jgi:putative hydrolase of the HAD superfamily
MCTAAEALKKLLRVVHTVRLVSHWSVPEVVKSVIFDLGGVVIEWNPDRILESYYADPESRAYMKKHLFQHPDWLELDRGTMHETELLQRAGVRTGREAAEVNGLFHAVRESLQVKPETVALLERLHGRGVPLYCLSNISADIFEYLRKRHSFWHVFKGIVISGAIKMIKPEPEIFHHLLGLYRLKAGETAFVDDNAPNIEAAKALGIHTVWFKNAGQCEAELETLLAG